jgi:hypothetical protein
VSRSPRRARLALAAALPLLLAPVTAGAADAATWTHQDARRDVTRVEYQLEGEGGRPAYSRAPEAAGADITRLSVRHLARTLVLTIGVRDLRPGDSTSVAGRLTTPRASYFLIAGRAPGTYTQMLMQVRGKGDTSCTGMATSFDASADVVRVEIPRTCLGAPDWVRAGVLLSDETGSVLEVTDPDDLPETITVTSDDALRDGGKAQAPSLGPKVRVG